jgi:hypothetical protein
LVNRLKGVPVAKLSPAVLIGVAMVISAGAAQAQLFGAPQPPRGPNAIPDNLDPAMCDQMAAIPNAPMSPEACRAMIGMAQGMKTSGADPSAMRPGDENLNCDQINAEMRSVATPMVSAETAAQARVAADAELALRQKQDAEQKAFVAGQVAEGVGASALGVLPGGGYAAMAAQQAMMAQQQAFIQKQQADAAPVRAQTSQSITATTTEMTRGMQQNPRFARLMNLSIQKNCPPPPDIPDPRR